MVDGKLAYERALLVGVKLPNESFPLESSLKELELLVNTAGAQVVGSLTQRLNSIHAATFIGRGKVKELAELVESKQVDVVVFDDELSPSQQSNLEKSLSKGVKVIDRTALILDIFALHAHTKEGNLQVRLAQNEYLYPRLRGMWAHLASNRMGGGIGSRFGEGESQLEVDRRMVRDRISSIKRELKHLETIRKTQNEKRYRSNSLNIALAGYTNAGKSTLNNRLTDADVLSEDKLFATLDSTTRKLSLPNGRKLTITDTIGFIRKLPTSLISSFKSTLNVIKEADLILHVIDASSENIDYEIQTVQEIIGEIKAEDIERIEVFNKADLIGDDSLKSHLEKLYPQAVLISALTGDGIEQLIERIAKASSSHEVYLDIVLPYDRGDIRALAHRHCRIVSQSHLPDGSHIRLSVPQNLLYMFTPYSSGDLNSPENGHHFTGD